ncbi:MAG: fluoride efflux transporter CrcB [Planctomycetota bacterium]|nr:MAG: fluoride efflux transporter CrcB [Planctomycetota bacterium]
MLAVGAGGFLGASCRYLAVLGIEAALPRKGAASWPLATLCVNVLGSFVLGYLLQRSQQMEPAQRLFWTTGLLGAFTTFSTFSVETLLLWREGRLAAALGYVAASVLSGLFFAWLGYRVGAARL